MTEVFVRVKSMSYSRQVVKSRTKTQKQLGKIRVVILKWKIKKGGGKINSSKMVKKPKAHTSRKKHTKQT
jgi:uncharacterized phosphosugar-binding protein